MNTSQQRRGWSRAIGLAVLTPLIALVILQGCTEPSGLEPAADNEPVATKELTVSEAGDVRASGEVESVTKDGLKVAGASFKMSTESSLTDADGNEVELSELVEGDVLQIWGKQIEDGSFEVNQGHVLAYASDDDDDGRRRWLRKLRRGDTSGGDGDDDDEGGSEGGDGDDDDSGDGDDDDSGDGDDDDCDDDGTGDGDDDDSGDGDDDDSGDGDDDDDASDRSGIFSKSFTGGDGDDDDSGGDGDDDDSGDGDDDDDGECNPEPAVCPCFTQESLVSANAEFNWEEWTGLNGEFVGLSGTIDQGTEGTGTSAAVCLVNLEGIQCPACGGPGTILEVIEALNATQITAEEAAACVDEIAAAAGALGLPAENGTKTKLLDSVTNIK